MKIKLITEGIIYKENKHGMEGVLFMFAAYYMRSFSEKFSGDEDIYETSELLLPVQSELSLLLMPFGTAQLSEILLFLKESPQTP